MPENDFPFLSEDNEILSYFRSVLSRAGEAISTDLEKHHSAFSGKTPQELKDLLKGDDLLPEKGLGSMETLSLVEKIILPHLVNPASTDYMAHLHCATLPDSIIAELIIAVYNQSMDSWDQAPVATELELHLIKELCRIAGLPEGAAGVFTSGGSQSNYMGMILARDAFCSRKLGHDVKKSGLPDNFRRFRIYTSCVAHFSVEKSAQLMGLGFQAVRPVPVDDRKKISVSQLRTMITEDIKNGFLPVAVSATAGTTDFGSIDPLPEIRSLCDEYGIWLHVDAAYGGGLLFSDKHRHKLNGIELADSVTVDFHKMLMQPVSCSTFLLKDSSLFEMLEIHADYLNREEDEEEGYTHLVGRSLATTRRFDALKVWMSFKSLGRKKLSELLDKTLDTATAVYDFLLQDPRFEPVTEPEISSVVFRYIDAESEDAAEEMNIILRRNLIHDEGVIIGQTRVDGKTFLKMTMLNPGHSFESVKQLLEKIGRMADRLKKNC